GSDDEATHMPGSMVESSKKKELKKFDFVTKSVEHIHLTKEYISAQKKIEEKVKAKAARRAGEIRKEELIDLLGLEVVNKYYNDKLQYDKYYDKILNRLAASRITNCDVLTRKGPITLKVYKEDELGINLNIPLSKQDPLDKLNDLVNKKRKHADDIHDYFKVNKRLKSSIQYEDYLPGTVLNEPVLVIKNGNKVLKRTVGIVEQIYGPTSAEEKLDRKNEMKARETMLMALSNKDQLKFHSYQDDKFLMEAIEKRYKGKKESKNVQRTLLKQQYKNFTTSSSETLDQTFDRLQKLISLLEIQGEVIEQEDMNLKLLRSLPSEWKTHALIWRNKADIETISLDDLYNNLKIYEPK
nr:ribonuclease H-like domain-containing protein [Tanacetum cinerariifolium]